ncbi:MAG: protein kinase, partial [Planctomycetales bacterium]
MSESSLTVQQYADAVTRSELLKPEQLAELVRELKAQPTAKCAPFAEALTERNLLTKWQNSHLTSGRFLGFFLGKYKLLEMLGAGGMGSVYLAEHILMRRKVAVKVLYPARVDQTTLERFYLECQAVAALNHPNIITAHHFDNFEEFLYLVMEFVDGPDLQSLIMEHGALPYLEAADYIAQAAAGLAHAHEAGMVHRDIKP